VTVTLLVLLAWGIALAVETQQGGGALHTG
jgi:hypothetical protein